MADLQRLVAVSGSRGVVYLTAAFTGLRRGELLQLEWRDLHLDAERPFVNVRASISKNHKQAMLPLHTDLVKALGRMRTANTVPMDVVFRGLIPRMTAFRKDLEAAGIAYVDAKGEYADFHSLRKTFGTMLTLAGVPQRVVMELMRHSDMRLTAKTYTDAGMLPVDTTITKLPSLNGAAIPAPQLAPQSLVPARPALSLVVRELEVPHFAGTRMNTGFERDLALPVNECPAMPESGGWCAMQGSNLRPLYLQKNSIIRGYRGGEQRFRASFQGYPMMDASRHHGSWRGWERVSAFPGLAVVIGVFNTIPVTCAGVPMAFLPASLCALHHFPAFFLHLIQLGSLIGRKQGGNLGV